MDLAQLRKAPHLSASSVSDYLSCGLMYFFGRVARKRPEFTPEGLILGSAVHSVLAMFYESLRDENPMTARQIQDLFEETWRKMALGKDDLRFKEGSDYERVLLEGKELLGAFHAGFSPDNAKIIGIEKAFRFFLPGLDVPIIGAYDLVLEDSAGVVIIVDHKTAARAYASADIDRSLQMTVYQMAARANGFENQEILLRFDCLIKTKVPKFEQYYTVRTKQDERKTAKKLAAVWDAIQKGVFVPNEESWKCQGCAYKQACEEWFSERRA